VIDQIDYLTGDREENFLVAQANAPMDAKGHFTAKRFQSVIAVTFCEVEPSKSTTWMCREAARLGCGWPDSISRA